MTEKSSSDGHRARLRDRWRRTGVDGFAEHELLELLLTHVFRRIDTKPLAKRLLARFHGLKGLLDATPQQIQEVEGAGPRAAEFVALLRGAMERYFETDVRRTDLLNSPEAVVSYCRAALEGLPHEVFDVIYLSAKNRVLSRERLAEGTIDQAAVYPRKVVTRALAANAAGLVFVHNHPSGDPEPSPEDRRLTQRLRDAAQLVGIPVLDHIIIGNGRHVSFREKGLL